MQLPTKLPRPLPAFQRGKDSPPVDRKGKGKAAGACVWVGRYLFRQRQAKVFPLPPTPIPPFVPPPDPPSQPRPTPRPTPTTSATPPGSQNLSPTPSSTQTVTAQSPPHLDPDSYSYLDPYAPAPPNPVRRREIRRLPSRLAMNKSICRPAWSGKVIPAVHSRREK